MSKFRFGVLVAARRIMSDMDACCAYFCTGLSIFGVLGLLFMYGILSSGGEWFLGISSNKPIT